MAVANPTNPIPLGPRVGAVSVVLWHGCGGVDFVGVARAVDASGWDGGAMSQAAGRRPHRRPNRHPNGIRPGPVGRRANIFVEAKIGKQETDACNMCLIELTDGEFKMVYHTPHGQRILENAERELFVHSLAMMVDMLEFDDAQFGIEAFDQLTRNQKLAVLYTSASALRCIVVSQPPKSPAAVEASVASIFEHARQEVCDEVDDDFWRSKLLAAVRQACAEIRSNLPDVGSRDRSEWSFRSGDAGGGRALGCRLRDAVDARHIA